MKLLIYVTVAGITILIQQVIYNRMIEKESRKANYNCENCKIWDCPNHYCRKRR